MKPDKLHRFLHALNLGEQRMCKKAVVADTSKWAAQRKKLFTTLMLQQTYDAAKLSKAIGDAAYLAELPTEKNRMYKRLLHTVLEHRASNEDSVDPIAKLHESQMLFSLGLREEAIETAEAGIRRAQRMADPLAETYLRDHQRQLLKVMKDDQPRMADNEEQLLRAARQVANLMECHVAADKVVLHHARYRTPETDGAAQELQRLMTQGALSDPDTVLSMPAKLRYLSAWAMHAESIGQLDATNHYLQQQLDLWEQYPERIAQMPREYLSCLANLIGGLIRSDKLAQVPALLQRLEQVPTTTIKDKVLAFCRLEVNYQLYHMNTGDLAAVVAREPQLMENLRQFSDMVADGFRITLYYNIGIAHLMLGNNGQALAMFRRMRDLGQCYDRLDLQGLARLFRLLLLLERYSLHGLDHYLRNSRSFFLSGHASYPMEMVVYRWLEEGCQHPETAMSRTRLLALHDLLTPMFEQRIIGAEELRKWALSRAEGIPMHSVTDSRNGDSDSMRQICA
jgi:hypothetical protein